MKLFLAVAFLFLTPILVLPQNRAEALAQFNDLKSSAAALERIVLAPTQEDVAAAARIGANAVRLLPREKYDNSFSSIRGGGSYYSFYYRVPDWGYGTEIGLEQDYLSTGFNDFGAMADLGEISLDLVSKEGKGVSPLANYSKIKYTEINQDFQLARSQGLSLDDTLYVTRLKPVLGHTYILRSIRADYYDILTAFKIQRKDTDGSLILIWKMLDQYDTPKRNERFRAASDQSSLEARAKGWLKDERFRDVTLTSSDNVTTLRGSIDRKDLPYAVQLANSDGATKVINLLTVR